jgi:hypothetical protein
MDHNAAADASRIRWAAAAGRVAPIWFWVTLTVLALLHGTIDVSGHQLLRYGLLMYIGFFAYGSLTLFFVWGLRRRVPRSRVSRAALVALTLFGCGPLLGTFTMGVEQGPPQSWHAALHFAGLLIVSLLPIVAMPLFGRAVWKDSRWGRIGPMSVVWAAVVALVVFLPSSPAEGYPLWSGPGSMADIALIGIWQIVVARRLASLATQPAIAEQTADAPSAENALG